MIELQYFEEQVLAEIERLQPFADPAMAGAPDDEISGIPLGVDPLASKLGWSEERKTEAQRKQREEEAEARRWQEAEERRQQRLNEEKESSRVASTLSESPTIREKLCYVLGPAADDVFEVGKAITPVLISLSATGVISVALTPLIVASLAILIGKIGISTFCRDVREGERDDP